MDEEDSPVIDLCCDSGSNEVEEVKTSTQENGIAGNNEKKTSDDLFAKLVQKQKSQKWECDMCSAGNDESQLKCLCCESPKPGSAPQAKPSSSFTSSSFSFGIPPASKTSSEPTPVADDLFKNIAAKQKSQNWECKECFTQNVAAESKCLCCQSPNPNSNNITKMPSLNSQENKPLDDEFKKIVSKQNNSKWECSTCLTKNDDSSLKCLCCEQPKPNAVANATSFSFGSLSSTSKVSLPPPSEVQFSFGMQTKSAVELPPPSEVKFSFGTSNNVKDNDEKKVEEKPPAPTSSAPVFGGFSFSSTPKVDENISKTTPVVSLLPPATLPSSSLQFNAKTETPTKSNDTITTTVVENPLKTSIFSFGSTTTENKSSLTFPKNDTNTGIDGIFKPTTTSSTINFGVTTESSSQQNNTITNNNNNNSLFQVKESEKPAEKVGGFSFGNNSTSSMFSFGGNKLNTDAVKPAVPVFGASPSFSSLASNNNAGNITNNNNNSQENLIVFGGPQKRTFDSSFSTAKDTSDAQNNVSNEKCKFILILLITIPVSVQCTE
jgi:nuclear pore complex protein Nup153